MFEGWPGGGSQRGLQPGVRASLGISEEVWKEARRGDQRIEVISILPLWQRSVRADWRRRRGRETSVLLSVLRKGGGVVRGEPVRPLALNYLEVMEGGAEGGEE